MKRIFVIDAGYGDSGKGRVVSRICNHTLQKLSTDKDNLPLKFNTIVKRFCGGPQAAHKVVYSPTKSHIYSHFGSGTALGIDTWWESEALVDVETWLEEYTTLQEKKLIQDSTQFYVEPTCKVITPYDWLYNQQIGQELNHGTCGFGINKTLRRNEDHYKLEVMDLKYEDVLRTKLNLIQEYYLDKYPDHEVHVDIEAFIQSCREFITHPIVEIAYPEILEKRKTVIYESSQGLLIDQDYGFFPHVTPASVGIKNNFRVIKSTDEYWYVTRAYHTRHGNGPFPCEPIKEKHFKFTHQEDNKTNSFQGEFRTGLLNLDLLLYALEKDFIGRKLVFKPINIVVTCVDNLKKFRLTYQGEKEKFENKEDFLIFILDKIQNILNNRVELYFSESQYDDKPLINLRKYLEDEQK